MSNPTEPAPSLWADIKTLERFPFAAAANLYRSPTARKAFVERVTRDESPVCPYATLRGLLA
jgi:hypothetical protein